MQRKLNLRKDAGVAKTLLCPISPTPYGHLTPHNWLPDLRCTHEIGAYVAHIFFVLKGIEITRQTHFLHTVTHKSTAATGTSAYDLTNTKYAYARIVKYRHSPHTGAVHTLTRRCAPACTQSQLPVLPLSWSGAPSAVMSLMRPQLRSPAALWWSPESSR